MDIRELSARLHRARTEGNLYATASNAMAIREKGGDAALSKEECGSLIDSLRRVRAGESIVALKRGCEIARWAMLVRHFCPEHSFELSAAERILIQEAFDAYLAEESFQQMAILKHACDRIGVTLEMDLDSYEKEEFKVVLATMK